MNWGEQMQLVNKHDTKTSLGVLSKGWYKDGNKVILAKGNSNDTENKMVGLEPFSEVLAFRFGRLLGVNVVKYDLAPAKEFPEIKTYECDYVSICESYKKPGMQLISLAEWCDSVAGKQVYDYFTFYKKSSLDDRALAEILVFDAVIGNSDRHLNNFDVLCMNGSERLGPVFDNGASLLSGIHDQKLKIWNGVGPDKAKPFKATHKEQINLVRKFLWSAPLFGVDADEVYRKWVYDCTDVFSLMNAFRAESIKRYVFNRLEYLRPFCTGGNVDEAHGF